MANKNTINLNFSWDGQKEAQLYYVVHNGRVVIDASDDKRGRGKIAVQYSVSASATHLIKWSLWFPGKTLKSLSCKVAVDGADASEIGSSKSEDDHWADEGIPQ